QREGIHVGAVAADDPAAFEVPDPLRDRLPRQPQFLGQGGRRAAAIPRERQDQPAIHLVQRGRLRPRPPPSRHHARDSRPSMDIRQPSRPCSLTSVSNVAARTVNVEPRVTLLRALRNHLDLTGAKEICDRGACGGCTVLLDGEPIASCLMLAADAEGHEITTVEGLGTPDAMSPVQAAFVEADALQCGFCTPGFVVSSTALLRKNANPSLEEVKDGLAGNICRCGTYSRVFE